MFAPRAPLEAGRPVKRVHPHSPLSGRVQLPSEQVDVEHSGYSPGQVLEW